MPDRSFEVDPMKMAHDLFMTRMANDPTFPPSAAAVWAWTCADMFRRERIVMEAKWTREWEEARAKRLKDMPPPK